MRFVVSMATDIGVSETELCPARCVFLERICFAVSAEMDACVTVRPVFRDFCFVRFILPPQFGAPNCIRQPPSA